MAKKFWKVVNTSTNESEWYKASSMWRVLKHLIHHKSPDWVFGVNIIEVNEDKSDKEQGDFLMEAVRDYFVRELGTQDDAVMLRSIEAAIPG